MWEIISVWQSTNFKCQFDPKLNTREQLRTLIGQQRAKQVSHLVDILQKLVASKTGPIETRSGWTSKVTNVKITSKQVVAQNSLQVIYWQFNLIVFALSEFFQSAKLCGTQTAHFPPNARTYDVFDCLYICGLKIEEENTSQENEKNKSWKKLSFVLRTVEFQKIKTLHMEKHC